MNIYDVLIKDPSRLSCGDKWLVMEEQIDNYHNEFVVYEHKYGAHKTLELYRGDDENMACEILTQ